MSNVDDVVDLMNRCHRAEARVAELEAQLAAHARAGCPQAVTEVAASVTEEPEIVRAAKAAIAAKHPCEAGCGVYVPGNMTTCIACTFRAPPTGGEPR